MRAWVCMSHTRLASGSLPATKPPNDHSMSRRMAVRNLSSSPHVSACVQYCLAASPAHHDISFPFPRSYLPLLLLLTHPLNTVRQRSNTGSICPHDRSQTDGGAPQNRLAQTPHHRAAHRPREPAMDILQSGNGTWRPNEQRQLRTLAF